MVLRLRQTGGECRQLPAWANVLRPLFAVKTATYRFYQENGPGKRGKRASPGKREVLAALISLTVNFRVGAIRAAPGTG
jgi:hypothetical protein